MCNLRKRYLTALAALPLLLLVAFVAAEEPTDYKELKKALPETIAGLKMAESSGQNINANGQKFSQVVGEYEGEEKTTATLNIVDYSAMPQMAMAMTAWKNMEFERESDDGYQKSTKIKDCPAMISWENTGTGSATVLVDDTFILQLDLRNATPEQFEQAITELPIEALGGV